MTQPDWAVTIFQGARSDSTTGAQADSAVSDSKLRQYTAMGANIAKRDDLAAGNVPVAGTAVSGTVTANSVGIAPATAVTIADTNMLVSQDFTDPTTVVGSRDWSWDGSDGHLTNGCAHLDCNGHHQDFLSNEVPVVVDENISLTCWAKWEDLVCTGGDEIVIGVQKYRKSRDARTGGVVYVDVGGAVIDTISFPGTDSGGAWVKLTGTYTVPAKVDQIRLKFHVSQSITAGVVKMDEAVLMKTDLIPDAAVPGVGTTVDNIVTGLGNTTGSGFTQQDSKTVLSNTAAAVTATSAKVAQVDATTSTGTIAGDDFNYSGDIITGGGSWTGTYSVAGTGRYVADGNYATWVVGDTSGVTANNLAYLKWGGAGSSSSTDYQKISVVLGSAPTTYGPTVSNVWLLGRISSDFKNYVMLSFSGDGLYKFFICTGGTEVQKTSGSITVPGTGSTLTFYCGDKGPATPLKFTGQVNGTTIFTYTDSGTSLYGASYRGWGFGGNGNYQASSLFSPPYASWPPKINQWIGVDQ